MIKTILGARMSNITVNCHIDRQYIVDTYYALLYCLDDVFTQKLDDSIADNMRNFTFTFDNEKIVKLNNDKNEVCTFYYSDLYQIQEAKTGLFFFSNKIIFEFLRYDLFQPNELQRLKDYLAPYLSKNQESKIATVNYQFDYQKVYAFICHQYRNLRKMMFITSTILFLMSLLVFAKNPPLSALIFILSILLLTIFLVNFKQQSKKQVLTLNERFGSMTCIFYNDHLITSSEKRVENYFNINYAEFFKIEKTPKGYVFLIQKHMGYFFFYEEFTLEQQQALEENLKHYSNYSEK